MANIDAVLEIARHRLQMPDEARFLGANARDEAVIAHMMRRAMRDRGKGRGVETELAPPARDPVNARRLLPQVLARVP